MYAAAAIFTHCCFRLTRVLSTSSVWANTVVPVVRRFYRLQKVLLNTPHFQRVQEELALLARLTDTNR